LGRHHRHDHPGPRAYQIADGYRAVAGRGVGGFHPWSGANEALLHADAVGGGEAEHVWSQVLSDVASGHRAHLSRQNTRLISFRFAARSFPQRSSLSIGSVQAARVAV